VSAVDQRDGRFSGVGGLEIYWQRWLPQAPSGRPTIVIAHGASEHGGRYGHLVERLVPAGYPVYAIDHRGHGRSQGKRAVIDRLANACADLDTLIGLACAERPDAPLFLLGHSLGGCIALAYALDRQERIDALILSAPAAALESASPVVRVAARVLSVLTPSLGVFAVDPAAISRDAGEVKAYIEDPLVYHGKLPARTVAEMAAAIERFPDRVGALTLPLLVIHGSADKLVPPAASEMVNARAGSADKTLRIYDGLFHEMFNELPPDRERVIGEVLGWLDAHA
jgi:alpha-beta hydrolase superfamily lysophospholipase